MVRPSLRKRRQEKRAASATKIGAKAPSALGVAPEIDIFFADDSRQHAPSRDGMGELVAIGGLGVPADFVRGLANDLESLCIAIGFPRQAEFKWSPSRNLWMHANLTGESRTRFFLSVLDALREAEAVAIVVIADCAHPRATRAPDSETDVTTMFIERVSTFCAQHESHAMLVVDRPSGDRRDEDKFLARCSELLESGTDYVQPTQLIHGVLSTPSRLSRLLQAADLVTGCTLARVAGEARFSPPVFEGIKPLLHRQSRVGGVGLKIHPDWVYCNLYHWLLGDKYFVRSTTNWQLPMRRRPYPSSADRA